MKTGSTMMQDGITRTVMLLCLMAAATAMTLSCDGETEDRTDAGYDSIAVEVKDGTGDGQTRTAYAGLTTTFEDGDAIGVYAVSGTTAEYSNIKFTLTDGSWVAGDRIPFKAGYTYYAYYPYRQAPAAPDFGAAGTEDAIFAGLISGWTAGDDQGTTEKFRANDLMIARGVNSSGRMVTFTMKHKMALAVLDSDVATFAYDTDPETRYRVAMTYGGKIPYFDGSSYYLIMRPDELTAIGGQQLKAGKGNYITGSGAALTEDYTMTFSTDGGSTFTDTPPSWLKGVAETKEPESGQVNFIVTVADEKTTDEVTETISYTGEEDISDSGYPGQPPYVSERLRAAPSVRDRDLSLYDNDGTERRTRTTANSYLVHNPGTYRIPLVYGNAIRNGETNTQAYHATGTGSNILTAFVRHDGQPITAPWIRDNGITVDGAELVWQDAKGLVTEVGIDGDYLTFTVPEENITAGNAVIAAKAGETTVWSWHIWATEETLDKTIKIEKRWYRTYIENGIVSSQGKIATEGLSTCYLGQVPTYGHGPMTKIIYKGAECAVRLSFANHTTVTFTVRAPDHGIMTHDLPLRQCATYYQWGRKDPMIPGDGQWGGPCHDTWNIDGEIKDNRRLGTDHYTSSTIGTVIQNPAAMFISGYNRAFDTVYENLWNTNKEEATKPSDFTATWLDNDGCTKTVYDPCPPGFRVPRGLYLHKMITDNLIVDDGIGNWEDRWSVRYSDAEYYLIHYMSSPNGDNTARYRQTRLWSDAGNYSFYLQATEPFMGFETTTATALACPIIPAAGD